VDAELTTSEGASKRRHSLKRSGAWNVVVTSCDGLRGWWAAEQRRVIELVYRCDARNDRAELACFRDGRGELAGCWLTARGAWVTGSQRHRNGQCSNHNACADGDRQFTNQRSHPPCADGRATLVIAGLVINTFRKQRHQHCDDRQVMRCLFTGARLGVRRAGGWRRRKRSPVPGQAAVGAARSARRPSATAGASTGTVSRCRCRS
jgi:hypothetical protein